MAINVTSFGNTPQATDDVFLSSATELTEDSTGIVWLSVMLNDKGGAAKTLYSLDDGLSDGTTLHPIDLLTQDSAEAVGTDTSRGGARIWITADGRVGYDSATLGADFAQQLQALNAGEYLYDSFTYAIRLGNGTLSWATATIQFAGANDAPVVTGAVVGTAVEDGAVLTLDALANASDVDAGSVLSVVDVPATLPPGVSYDAATHSFSIDPGHAAYQHLGAGVVLPVSVVYGVSDGTATTSAAVTFTITGTNDAAVIGDLADSEVTEDADISAGSLQASGVLAISDVDTGEAAFQTTVAGAAGNLGGLDLAADGSYTYSVANAAVQFLGAGDSHVDTFTVTALDGTTKNVSFTVHGINDAAMIGDPTTAVVTEDTDIDAGSLRAAGTLSITDADQDEASFLVGATTVGTALGTLALEADGDYTYSVANSAVQFLGAGDTKVDTFTVTALDGTTKNVSFTVHGINDAAVIGDPTSAAVTEDTDIDAGGLRAAGTLSITDADQDEASFQLGATPVGTALGTLDLEADGDYTYSVANSAVQFLGAGDSQIDTFTVAALDGTTKAVSFTVHGINDPALIGDPTNASVTEDVGDVGGNLTAVGSISISDVDQDEASFQTGVVAATGTLGSLTLATDGNYTYSVANADVQSLGGTATHTDTFAISALDGTTKAVSFTVHGINDPALIGDPTNASVTEDVGDVGGNLTAVGSISISDVDQDEASFQTGVVAATGTLGSLTLATDGNYTYSVANADVQSLGGTATHTDTFTVSALDGTTKNVTFTVQGANDPALIGDPTNASVTEDVGAEIGGNLTAVGSISISDVDQDEASFQTGVVAATGTLGSLTLATDGNYTYSVANADVQSLGGTATHTDTFTISALDGTTKDVTFTVHGANDAALIGDPTNASVTEDVGADVGGKLTAVGSVSISDVDQDEASFQTGVVAATGNLGSLTLATDGNYTYSVANADVQSFGATTTHTDTFTISALDGTTKDVTFTVQGANDPALIGDPTNASVTEDVGADVDGNLTAVGSISISDVDQDEASFQTGVVAATGTLGSLTLATDGNYTYSVANADVQSLGGTATHTDTFTISALDGTTKDVTFTVHGANDAALIGDPTNAAVTEDVGVDIGGNLTAVGSISISDVDQDEASFQTTVTPAAGALGSLVLAASGDYTYSVANVAVQALGATDTRIDTFTVTSLDGTTKDVSFTINGANDVALISGVASASVQEDTGVVGGQLLAGGLLSVADLDAGQSSFLAQGAIGGTHGTFTLAADGNWTYAVSNSLATVQALNTGQSLTDNFTAQSLDGSASQLVTVTILGQNDTPSTTGNDTYSFAATGSGVHVLNDPGGNSDGIAITDPNVALSTLSFEKIGNDLHIQVNGQSITVQNHFAGNDIEEISFASGQTYAGYSLAGDFNIFSEADFEAGNGSSADVVAGTSGGELLDGGAGNSGRDLLFGNGDNDTLIGRNQGDLLVAGAGNDSLQGGDGNDVLVGGAGSDTFLFDTALNAANNVDRVADFEANAIDFLILDKSIFTGLSTPASAGGTTLQASEFSALANADSASVGGGVHVLFDTATGNLYYDSNGGSSGSRTLFATLDPAGLSGMVDATDFKVVT